MKRRSLFFPTLALGLLPLTGLFVIAPTKTDAQSPPQAGLADSMAQLSPPARDVVGMAFSGVPNDTLMTFIGNSTVTFNLTPENIVQLQGIGFSPDLAAAMLSHDQAVLDNPGAFPPQAMGLPPQVNGLPPQLNDLPPQLDALPPQLDTFPPQLNDLGPQFDDSPSASNDFPPEMNDLYNNLSPYGTWGNLAGFGWCWQPAGWVDFSSFAGLPALQSGHWRHHPNRGWLWFPGSNFHAPHNSFATPRQFVPGQNHPRTMGRPFATPHHRR